MHASDVWVDKLAMFISQRCDLCCWSAVFQRCRRRRRLPPVYRLYQLEAILDMNNVATSAAIFYHRRRGRCSSDRQLLSEPGSARYSSTPPLTTIWSNYQTLFNDFFEMYKTVTVPLHHCIYPPIRQKQRALRAVLSSLRRPTFTTYRATTRLHPKKEYVVWLGEVFCHKVYRPKSVRQVNMAQGE